MNILALGAHPDDVECMCGGTLLKYRAQGQSIFIALTTSGNTGSNDVPDTAALAAVREAEQLAAARGYNAQARFLRFDDEGLSDTQESRVAVLAALRWAKPDVVLTNCPTDGSTDHAVTGGLVCAMLAPYAAQSNAKRPPSVFFWDTAGGLGFTPDAYVNVDAQMAEKLRLLSCHKSQYAWMDTFREGGLDDACAALARLRGIQAGCRYAEAFIGLRAPGNAADFRLLP